MITLIVLSHEARHFPEREEREQMNRAITITELKAMRIDSWSVKDNSIRGITTKYTSNSIILLIY